MKKNSKRKNPIPNNRFVGFIYHLIGALQQTWLGNLNSMRKESLNYAKKEISQALNYKSIGKNCTDCGKHHQYCKCEGSRTDSTKLCEECSQNYCICEHNFLNIDNPIYLQLKIIEIAYEYMNKDQFETFLYESRFLMNPQSIKLLNKLDPLK